MIRTRLPSALLALSLVALAACSSSKGNDAPEQKEGSGRGFKSLPPEVGDPAAYKEMIEPHTPAILGAGIEANNHKVIPNRCIDGTTQTVPNQEGMFSLDADYTRTDIEKALGVSTSGGVKFMGFGASARASYAQKMREQSYGLNYVVFVYAKHHSEVFLPTGRNANWKNANTDEWLKSCGTGYIAAQDYGSMLIIKFSLALEDKSVQTSWGGGASGSYLSFAKMKAAVNKMASEKKSKGTLSLSAIQVGGKPAELGKLLAHTSSEDGTSSVVQSFSLCDISDVAKCLKGLDAIDAYVSTDYPKQMEDMKTGGPAIMTTYPFPYPKMMGADINPAIEGYVVKARQTLSDLYDQEMDDVVKINTYAKKTDKDALAIADQAMLNVTAIREASELCYNTSTYQECNVKTDELTAACALTNPPAELGVGDSGNGNRGSDQGE